MKAILQSKLALFIKECRDNEVPAWEILEVIEKFLAGGSDKKSVRSDGHLLFDGEIEVEKK